jgi:hypothetical protein
MVNFILLNFEFKLSFIVGFSNCIFLIIETLKILLYFLDVFLKLIKLLFKVRPLFLSLILFLLNLFNLLVFSIDFFLNYVYLLSDFFLLSMELINLRF